MYCVSVCYRFGVYPFKRVTLLSRSLRSWFLSSSLIFVFLLNGSKGSIVGHWVKAEQPVLFVQGNNDLLLLTQTVGLQVKILLPIFSYYFSSYS